MIKLIITDGEGAVLYEVTSKGLQKERDEEFDEEPIPVTPADLAEAVTNELSSDYYLEAVKPEALSESDKDYLRRAHDGMFDDLQT